ncbi:hypothetical protein, partial [Desulfonatronovibrio magnus]|uniref:hypothetical protein n=1 Tax=Desulfonatronovibrio magnus TaxID=698827 RepID=UPI0005EB8BA5
MELQDQLFETLISYWDLQQGNYDIERNYPELLDIDLGDPELTQKLRAAAQRSREIISTEKPKADPETEAIFREGIAPVPNNRVLSVITRAILCGGEDFGDKPEAWVERSGGFVFQDTQPSAGEITVTAPSEEVIQGFSLFTLDVLMVLLGHLSSTYCQNKTDQPMALKSIVTTREILGYKEVKSYGERRWNLIEKISAEVERLGNIKVKVSNAKGKDGPLNYNGKLIILKLVKRDFNPFTKHYTPTCWEIQAGSWAMHYMSKDNFEFIGKLSQEVLALDHREQRGTESFAKKIMYSLFVLPGGTHYIKNGAKKSFKQLLQLIGEYRETPGLDRKVTPRNLQRLGKALDYL